MPKTNQKIIDRIKPSGTMTLFGAVKQMRDAGEDIVSFTAGEVNFNSPPSAKEAAIKAINDNFTRYTISEGTIELREKVAERLQNETGQKFNVNEILITNGCKQGSYNVLMSIIADGDEVILPVPYYTSHIHQIELLGATPVLVQATIESHYQLTKEMLESVVSSRTKVLLVTSPQNPTGAVYNEESLKVIADFVKTHDLWLIFDEIYSGIVYPPVTFNSILKSHPELRDRMFIVNALSKTFAMTGWRIGFAAGPQEIIKRAANVQANTTSNVSSISQMAALGALTKEPHYYKNFLSEYQNNRDYCCEFVSNIEGLKCSKPDGAFYLFPNVRNFIGRSHGDSRMNSGDDIAHYLLKEHKVAIVPGSVFGAPDHLRISFSTDRATLEKGLVRIKKGLEQLT